ncbi:hypothetical protein ADZ36_05245 [Streptomyces fradiae]|uniref:Uncharacterized protein n=2 Tax=Streptomyces TaxID=1883 RepID=A0A420V760_9ACTN|nr:hypothetical protein ADZ36_05245 [Streptomyces fradiae]OFA62021.1 hypothetical protein BEN35_00620 [Streptomyces fradiae]PQM24607.1 hypothetical protein Sfr7A_05765 [Streptomyces xinghaiensis]RKM97479.1 hypothetical protein SFRA_008450 [Streptomyces xinghaiensis]RNC75630.1 hypothetical protein DC095_006150 [Streptomyces xinghaiensis]
MAALKSPLREDDRAQGWTDDLRREVQEEISIHRSVLRRHGLAMARHLRPRLDGWMEHEGVRPGRLRNLVADVQRSLAEARTAAAETPTTRGVRPRPPAHE